MTHVGPRYPFDLNEDAERKLREKGFWAFGDLIATAAVDRTPFETALMTALHWYADQVRQPAPANKLLSLTIAAETLFPSGGRGRIAFGCAEGVAFVLETDPDGRRHVRQSFRSLYNRRGDVAHEGSTVVSEREVWTLANLVAGTLLSLVGRRGEFETTQDLADWVDSQRLA
jgi:hypothetical protein